MEVPVVGGRREGSEVGGVGARSLEPAAALGGPNGGGCRSARGRGARAHGLGTAADRRRDRGRALDGARDSQAPWLLARATSGARGVLSLRVAVPGRSAAHGRQ